MPEDRVFIDTNIMIYAYDVTAGKKHRVACNILTDLCKSDLGVISTQVLQGFFVNVVQKIQKPIDKKLAKEIIRGDTELTVQMSIDQTHVGRQIF
jgi:predicted nucleic acid-binding protein